MSKSAWPPPLPLCLLHGHGRNRGRAIPENWCQECHAWFEKPTKEELKEEV